MAKEKEKHSFDDLKRLGDEKREEYDHTVQRFYPDKIIKLNDKNVNIGKICKEWYQTIYDYAPNPKDEDLLIYVFFIDAAYELGVDLDDTTAPFGKRWHFLMKYDYQLGKQFRVTMDQTKNELTRLLTRK